MKLFLIFIFLIFFLFKGSSQSESLNKNRIELVEVSSSQIINIDEEALVIKNLKDMKFKLNFIKSKPILYQEAIDNGWISDIEKIIKTQKEKLNLLQK